MNALVPVASSSPLAPAGLSAEAAARLVESFLAGRSPRTLQAYREDLADFARFVGVASADEAAGVLLSRGHGSANELALLFVADLKERGLAPSTIARRLAAVRSMVTMARTLGMVAWKLEVRAPKITPYRDTRGPNRESVALVREELASRKGPKAARDKALFSLLHGLALRRAEVLRLDVVDVDFETGTVAVLGKGRGEKESWTLPEGPRAALAAWLEVRGTEPGPVFVNFDRGRKGQGNGRRLALSSLNRLAAGWGKAVGVTLRPHGLRHAAITEALELTDGNVRAVQRFSRHRDLRVLTVYDDNRRDLAGDVARLLDASFAAGSKG